MPTLRFSLQLDEYKPAPDTTTEPRPTDVAAECKPRWALHEHLRTAFAIEYEPELWQDDEDTEEKACSSCQNFTISDQYRCSTCRSTYCREKCRDHIPTRHDRICTKFAEFPTESRPSEHHYRALFLPCRIDEPQLVWLKVAFDDSVGKLHIETDCQEAFDFVKEMKLPACALSINDKWEKACTPYGIELITFNSNENVVRQEKWYNRSLLGFAAPGHVEIVYGPAFVIAYNVDRPPDPIDIGQSSSDAGDGQSDKDGMGGEADEADEGCEIEEGDEECDNEGEKNKAQSGKQKVKRGSARRKKGKGKRKVKKKKGVPRAKGTADVDNADEENAQNDNEALVDIPEPKVTFRSPRDVGIREIDICMKFYVADPKNPVDGAPWLPVYEDSSSEQLHALKINNIEDVRLKALGVQEKMEPAIITDEKFYFFDLVSGCAEMYRLGLRWHLLPTMPRCAPMSISETLKDLDFEA
ncbi:hypothetical protein CGCSCA5_v011034 [Colletotrichum siamense]|nr:hypothetical protein CGCSCA5_v011034 [Colletotrichum siamense]